MVDDWLKASTVVLDSGDAEIEFDSGAIVSLRGPAQFEVSSPNRGSLVYGILRVEVPELAEAFTVHTPWAEAIATNALFGLSVSKDDRTDLHVLQGQVKFAGVKVAWRRSRVSYQVVLLFGLFHQTFLSGLRLVPDSLHSTSLLRPKAHR